MNSRFQITTNPVFEEMVRARAVQMIADGEQEAVIDDARLGKLSVFIDTEPETFFLSYEVDGHKVYVGGNA